MTFPANPLAPISNHIEALIFDCDGTLVHTMPTHYRAWTKALGRHGITFNHDQFYGFAGMPTRAIIEILAREQGLSVDAEQIAIEKEDVYLQLVPGVTPINEVIAIARREQGRRKLAVASGGWRRVVEASLKSVGILDLFPVIVGADEVPHGKPHPDSFLEAARRMGVLPDKCLIFEDGDQGFEAARRAHIPAIDVRPWYLEQFTSSNHRTAV